MAVESAIILARLLANHEPSDELFRRYTSIRRPRTDLVTRNARRSLKTIHTPVTGIWRVIRDFVITWFAGMFLRSGMMGHYAYDAGTVALG